MKICKSTKAIKGCGIAKALSQFPKTEHGHQAVCKKCIADHRRIHDKLLNVDPDAELFKMANVVWR